MYTSVLLLLYEIEVHSMTLLYFVGIPGVYQSD